MKEEERNITKFTFQTDGHASINGLYSRYATYERIIFLFLSPMNKKNYTEIRMYIYRLKIFNRYIMTTEYVKF